MEENINFLQRQNNTHQISKSEKILFLIVILDVLFFPYITPLYSSISMWILILWFPRKFILLSKKKEILLFFIVFLCMTVSIVLSSIYNPNNLVVNITRAVILIYGFLYYFYFKFYFKKFYVNISFLLKGYLIFNLILGFIYYISPQLYFYVRSFWTMSGNIIEVGSSLSIYRFTGILSDPNNFAVIINTITFFILFNIGLKKTQKLVVLLITGFLTIISMSTTGIIIYSLLILLVVVNKLFKIIISLKVRKKDLIFSLGMLLVLPIILIFLNDFLSSDIATTSLDRVESNTADSRLRIWLNLVSNKNILNHIVLGEGGSVIVNNRVVAPHNGHLHLIYSYGLISYIIFMYIFFRFREKITFNSIQRYFFLIPLFIGFTVNVGIYENRFINIMGLLVGMYSIQANLDNKNI